MNKHTIWGSTSTGDGERSILIMLASVLMPRAMPYMHTKPWQFQGNP